MIPYLEIPSLHLGPFTLQAFGLFAALGVYMGARTAVREAERQGKDSRALADWAIWGVLCGVLFGHLVHLFMYHPEELHDPKRILTFWEGLSSFGGLLGGVLAALVFFRVKHLRLSEYTDALALGIAPGWGIARIGCFVIHDHPGTLTTFPLAVNFPPSTMATLGFTGVRHDLGLYDAIALFAFAAVLFALDRRGVARGKLLGVLALLYGTSRFLFDFLRATDVPYADKRYFLGLGAGSWIGFTPAQFFCFGLWAYGLYVLLRPAPAAAATAAAEPEPARARRR